MGPSGTSPGGRKHGADGVLQGKHLACIVAASAEQPKPSSGGVRTGFAFGTSFERQRAAPGWSGLPGCRMLKHWAWKKVYPHIGSEVALLENKSVSTDWRQKCPPPAPLDCREGRGDSVSIPVERTR